MSVSRLNLSVLLLGALALCRGQDDATIRDGGMGSQIVEAVVERISARCVLPEDRLFLGRVAYVMSRNGQDSNTYRPGFHGGIWQVTETMFKATKACTNSYLRHACGNITASFGVYWPLVTWSYLRKPLFSGLAAALYTLLTLGGGTMPGSDAKQADLWVKMYGGSKTTFTRQANLLAAGDCTEMLDLAFILDSSGSVSASDFKLMLELTADVIDAMDVKSVRVADIVYSDNVQLHFGFNSYTTKAEARKKTMNTPKLDKGTATNKGLDQAASTLFDTNAGARKKAKKVAVLITDGKSDSFNATVLSAQALKDLGTTVFAVGVGDYNLREIQAVASKPRCSHVLTLKSFQDIHSIRTYITERTCEVNKIFLKSISGLLPISGTIEINAETKTPPKNETLEAKVVCGILDVYMSTFDPKPSPAVYDRKYHATPNHPAVLTVTEKLPTGSTVFLTVVGTRLPASAAAIRNCSDYSWSMGVAPKKEITLQCEVNGVKRPCSKQDLVNANLVDQDDSYPPVDNPCTASSMASGITRHPYPYDSTSFLQCDANGQHYITLCPNGVSFNRQTRKCGYTSMG